jgi:Family of unknown function (DUF6949)
MVGMFDSLLMCAYLVLIGVAAGGVAITGHRLLTDRRVSFQVRPSTVPAALAEIVVLAFGGPFVLMRDAIRAHLFEHRPLAVLAVVTVVASLWCFFSGVFLLNLIARFA